MALSLSYSSWGLSLGKEDIKSSLAEPLRIEVPINLNKGESLESLSIKQASNDEYQALDIPKSFAHSLIKVKVDKSASPHLVIYSDAPFNEPFLQYVVSVKSPKQRLLKTVTALLDTPKN